MAPRSDPVAIQPVMTRMNGLWYYEWFAGIAQTNWSDAGESLAADRWMVETLKRRRHETRGLPIGVNLAFLTAAHEGEDLVRALRVVLEPGAVVELTEHATAHATPSDMQGFFRTCAALQRAGFQVALDDCDTNNAFGDASLWESVQPQIIKIDMRSPGGLATAQVAHAKGFPTIYECVESLEARGEALSAGAWGLQGFAIGRPEHIGHLFFGAHCA